LGDPVYKKVREEQLQDHATRKALYEKIEKIIDRPVISLCTSFRYPVMLEDSDADMLEGVLRACDHKKGLALLISSPGGVGLTAERIITICRSYSATGEYSALVPAKAKSAATMICLGASEIIMGNTSELGPIDPQMSVLEDDRVKRFSLYNVVKSYETLFGKAVKEKGHLEPYLQQLSNYDEREISEFRTELSLAEDIAVRALQSGMLKTLPAKDIRKKISIFLIPEKRAKVHARPINAADALSCGLNIKLKGVKDKLWDPLYELYIRLNNYVSINSNAKIIECCDMSYSAKYEARK